MSEQHAKILIVDDRPENIHAMLETLAPLEVEMLSANSGREALALMLKHDFSLVLMDVQMPEMDGFETADLMQKNAATRSVPIIFVTAISKDARHEYKGYESGAVDYIFKPVNPDILFGKVRVFVNLHEMRLENVRMQQEVQKGRNLESLGLLAGGIAHEFNNLLSAIMGNVELALLDMEPANSGACDLLTESQKAGKRAQKLAARLLTFAKGGDPVKQQTRLEDVIRDSVNFVLHGSKTACRFEFASDLPPVQLDSGQFSEVIQNIIVNSRQAMPKGGIITITTSKFSNIDAVLPLATGRYVEIKIQDQGCGIAPEYLNKVFDPYFTTGEHGHGLGLSITHSIVNKHDGHIKVESELGLGTTMSIYLPVMEEEKNVSEAVAVEDRPTDCQISKKVIIMDDEEVLGKLVVMMLGREGYEVIIARDGDEALAIYQKHKDDGDPIGLVIMDLTIPGGMGGEEAIVKLLAIDPAAKAVVASGYANDPVMANYQDYGFVGMLSKPFEMKELVKVVQEAISATGSR